MSNAIDFNPAIPVNLNDNGQIGAAAVLTRDAEPDLLLEHHDVEFMPMSGDHLTRWHHQLTGHLATYSMVSIWDSARS